MKIKKVEIQAFRAYDKVEDGTFDFTMPSQEIANFISIYAPNGFGKTSFYDAIEWGYSNKIGRFDTRGSFNSDLAKSERSYTAAEDGQRQQQLIIRNKFSKLKNGFVKLHTTVAESPFINKVPKVKKGASDYKFKEQEALADRPIKFSDILLSQDWIDAFLKEDDAHVRYDKFTASFGDKALDNKYKTVTALIKLNKSKIKDCNDRLKKLEPDLSANCDEAILQKINTEIDLVNKKGAKLSQITAAFSQQDEVNFANLITDAQSTITLNTQNNKKREQNITLIMSGGEDIRCSVAGYYESKTAITLAKKQLTDAQQTKKDLQQKDEIKNEIVQLQNTADEKAEKRRQLQHLNKRYPHYQTIKAGITKAQQTIEDLKGEVKSQNKSLDDAIALENALTAKKEANHAEYSKTFDQSKKAADIFVQITTQSAAAKDLKDKVESNTKNLTIQQDSVDKNINSQKRLSKTIGKVIDRNYPGENELDKPYSDVISQLQHDEKKLEELAIQVKQINEAITQTESLNGEIKNLIHLGSNIVNNNELATCPLCNHDHADFSALAATIANNPLLEDKIKDLLENKTATAKQYTAIEQATDAQREDLITRLKATFEENRLKVMREAYDSQIFAKQIEEQKQQLDEHELAKQALALSVENLDEAEYTKQIEARLATQSENGKTIIKSLKDAQQARQHDEEAIALKTKQIASANEKIGRLKKDTDFQEIVAYQKAQMLITDIDGERLKNDLTNIESQIKSDAGQSTQLNKQFTALSQLLARTNAAVIEVAINDGEKQTIRLNTILLSFEQFVTDKLEFDLTLSNRGAFEDFLTKEKEKITTDLSQFETFKQQLEKIDRYKANVQPFLKYEKNKKEHAAITAEKHFFENVMKPALESEKEHIANFIGKQINAFFYQDLINILYGKIDPHPKYKQITFKCDFSQDKPRLDIFVIHDSSSIVPTLYFSAAQLNILSLSIFLAKALNARDENGEKIDCIFIDDPIQAMDSINILSTIDLLRSISVNLDKQIILSTHDENFHDLLKMKIPENLFKAKHMALETFGKVKRQ